MKEVPQGGDTCESPWGDTMVNVPSMNPPLWLSREPITCRDRGEEEGGVASQRTDVNLRNRGAANQSATWMKCAAEAGGKEGILAVIRVNAGDRGGEHG